MSILGATLKPFKGRYKHKPFKGSYKHLGPTLKPFKGSYTHLRGRSKVFQK